MSYDSTNKNSQAGDTSFVEFGNAKDDKGLPIVNNIVATEVTNQIPLFYDPFCGSINDVSQSECFVNKAMSYGYQDVGFILDRGYFSRKNIEYMDEHGFSFVMMVKGCRKLVHSIVDEKRDTFEAVGARHAGARPQRHYSVESSLRTTSERFSPVLQPDQDGEGTPRDRRVHRPDGEALAACHGQKGGARRQFRDLFDLFFDPQDRLLFETRRGCRRMYRRCGYFCIVTSRGDRRSGCLRVTLRGATSRKLSAWRRLLPEGAAGASRCIPTSMSFKLFVEFIARSSFGSGSTTCSRTR